MSDSIGGVGTTPLLVVHILLLVSWLGLDAAVFYASFHLRAPGHSSETRLLLMRIMSRLDRGARISLVLLVPVSIGLARVTGAGLTGIGSRTIGWIFWILTIGALAWVGVFLRMQALAEAGRAPRARRAWSAMNSCVHVGILLFFGATAIASLSGVHHYWADYAAVKAGILAALVALGFWIDATLKDLEPSFVALVEAETPARLQAFDRMVRTGYAPVLVIYAGLIASVVVGVAKP